MKKLSLLISLLALSVMLAACQDAKEGETANHNAAETEETGVQETDVQETDVQESGTITIEGLGDHYHTGDTIELSAVLSENVDYDHWHWYIKESDQTEWEAASGQEGDTFTGEATTDGLEIKATLYDGNHEVYSESEPVTIVIDDHHGHDEESKNINAGIFEDEQVKDRELSDWEGDWQSVYPYLLAGDLDEVFEHKAEEGDMTAEEYKEYYTTGYETDVERIIIENGNVTFFRDGKESSGDYEYDGYEILTYEAGNRGVRFIYKLVDENADMPQYIQFSDHLIFPTDSHHYHLYWGDDREALLEEVTNWPTYYPSDLDAEDIVRDQLAH
ncbi:ZinT family metal-binding protein [Paenibacillus shunpengii]|uniref:ZinT family metal-binding protein n=1 Tax=Paenibacillus shunpengii TaxID=2054424 RepID=A0ABW5SIZ0_9BACL|nr:metal-binding protein ZinT [Paenibacillus sp. PDC88]SDX45894.1 zinc transport system substrate-binding protein [Paenibacillus sp. PDC88]